MKNLFAIFLLGLVIGCVTTPLPTYTIKIDSDPPGARVFFSMSPLPRKEKDKSEFSSREKDYIGLTPCSFILTGTRHGDFIMPKVAKVSKYVGGTADFIAEPPSGSTNLFPQVVSFRGKSAYVAGDKIPSGIFFDMHKSK
jgi:hypothetical protein